jgi:hypothetical protein
MSNRASRDRNKIKKLAYKLQHPAPEMRQTRPAPLPVHTCREYRQLSLEERMELVRKPGHVMQIHHKGQHLGSIQVVSWIPRWEGEQHLQWLAHNLQGIPITSSPHVNWRVAVINLKAYCRTKGYDC